MSEGSIMELGKISKWHDTARASLLQQPATNWLQRAESFFRS